MVIKQKSFENTEIISHKAYFIECYFFNVKFKCDWSCFDQGSYFESCDISKMTGKIPANTILHKCKKGNG